MYAVIGRPPGPSPEIGEWAPRQCAARSPVSGGLAQSLLVQPDAFEVAHFWDLAVALHELLITGQIVGVIQEGESGFLARQVLQVLKVLGALGLVGRRAFVFEQRLGLVPVPLARVPRAVRVEEVVIVVV